ISIKAIGIVLSILFLLNAHWVIPLLISIVYKEQLTAGYIFTTYYTKVRSFPLTDVVRLMGYRPSYFELSVQLNPSILWETISFLLPAFAFLTIFLKRDKKVIFFISLALISIFLGKGAQPPFGEAYIWMLQNIPFFQLFRSPYKFVALTCLAYAVLLGIFSEELSLRIYNVFKKSFVAYFRNCFHLAISLGLIVMVIIYSWPTFTGDFYENLQTFRFSDEYKGLNDWLMKDQGDFRVLWTPWVQPFRYQGMKFVGVDPIIGYPPKPTIFFYDERNDEPSRFIQFLTATFYQNRTKNLEKILGISNIKYIIQRSNVETEYQYTGYLMHYPHLFLTNNKLDNVLSKQADINEVKAMKSLRILEVKDIKQHICSADNIAIVAGDRSAFVILSYVDEDFANSTLFFASQLKPENTLLLDISDTAIIINNEFYDLVLSFSDGSKIEPGANLAEYNPKKSWVSIPLWWWYNYGYQSAIENSAFTMSKADLIIPFIARKSGEHAIWIKLFFGPKGVPLTFEIDGAEIKQMDTKAENELGFKWVYLGSKTLKEGNHILKIRNLEDGENVIARIAVAPVEDLSRAHEKIASSFQNKRIVLLSELEKFELSKGWVFSNDWNLNASLGYIEASDNADEMKGSIYVPKRGEYSVYLRAAANKTSQPNLFVKIGSEKFEVYLNSSFCWQKVGELLLEGGYHNFSFIAKEGIRLDQLMVKSTSEAKKLVYPAKISYQKLNPSEYVVNVNAEKPFILIFSEAYNPYWTAFVNNVEVKPFIANSFANGYYIGKAGDLKITLKFTRQKYYSLGLIISSLTFAILLISLTSHSRFFGGVIKKI
ncbi:MAG: hypothetical protein HY929_05855, partial [Euryarchaeota archaeon]|nr:hypothetical protein [Euryarchaeota archaeon]